MAAGERPATMRAVQYSGYGGGAAALKVSSICFKSSYFFIFAMGNFCLDFCVSCAV
jgi:hypothetical protein